MRVSNRRSRLVRMPTSLFLAAVHGDRERPRCGSARHDVERLGRSSVRVDSVTGSTIMPLSERLTRSTSSAWRSIGHVPVDDPDAALLGQRDRQVRLGHRIHGRAQQRDVEGDVAREPGARSTWFGSTVGWRGTSSTSSKVRAVVIPASICWMAEVAFFSMASQGAGDDGRLANRPRPKRQSRPPRPAPGVVRQGACGIVAPWHFLHLLAASAGHGSLRPTFGPSCLMVRTSASSPPHGPDAAPPAGTSPRPRPCRYRRCGCSTRTAVRGGGRDPALRSARHG